MSEQVAKMSERKIVARIRRRLATVTTRFVAALKTPEIEETERQRYERDLRERILHIPEY